MIASILLFIAELAFGILIIDFFDPEKKLHISERIIAGFFIGFLTGNFLILGFALITSFLIMGILLFLSLALALLIFRIKKVFEIFTETKKHTLGQKWISLKNLWLIVLLVILISYFFFLSTWIVRKFRYGEFVGTFRDRVLVALRP